MAWQSVSAFLAGCFAEQRPEHLYPQPLILSLSPQRYILYGCIFVYCLIYPFMDPGPG
jgi:hypothetical protein